MKLPVSVIMGGPSAEYEVSLNSGRNVLVNIDKGRYEVRAIIITRDSRYYSLDIQGEGVPSPEALAAPGKLSPPYISPLFRGPFAPCDRELWERCKAAFLALHGELGEDGRFQGFLDTLGIPYNGSGVAASAIAMNKITSKRIFAQCGLDTPLFSVYGKARPAVTAEALAARHGFPCYVKCPQSGSSRLMDRASDAASLRRLLDEYTPYADEILVETDIRGVEFTCPVLERPDGSVQALPPVEIRPVVSDFFDYEAKYRDKGSEEIVPAPRSPEILARIREAALRAHAALGCRGVSRTDMIMREDRLYVLEVNTLPGLTANSLLPKSFAAAGGSFPELIDILIQTALVRPSQACK